MCRKKISNLNHIFSIHSGATTLKQLIMHSYLVVTGLKAKRTTASRSVILSGSHSITRQMDTKGSIDI
jgi:hypothetical protein